MKSNPFRPTHLLLVTLLLAAAPAGARAGVTAYATTPGAVKSSTYSLTVDGQTIFVEKFKDISYARFVITGTANVEIDVASEFSKVTVSPIFYGILPGVSGKHISLAIDQPRTLILQLKGVAEKLFIFADPPETDEPRLGQTGVTNFRDFISTDSGGKAPDQTKALQRAIDTVSARGGGILFIPNGKYLTTTFHLKDNVSLYLESGALIQGSDNPRLYDHALILFDHVKNARVYGRGVLAMAGTQTKKVGSLKIRICNLNTCESCGIYDVILRDSGGFNIHILNSRKIVMSGYKIIDDLDLPNEDGTDPDGCDGVTIQRVFMYTSDDAIAVKADHQLCQNVLIKDCVFWTKKSALKIGSDPYFGARNITFQNIDVVHADRALALYSGKGPIENVKFIDDRSEFVGGDSKRQLIVFQVSSAKEHLKNPDQRGVGYIRNVEVINYTAYQKSQNPSVITGTVAGDSSVHKVSHILFRNLMIDGKHCFSAHDAGIVLARPDTVEDLRFE